MSLIVVGLGPGAGADLTQRARAALERADVIVGYTAYVDLVRADFPHARTVATPMRGEVARCRAALNEAAAGAQVAVVCSGDPGVYGMAGLILELAQEYPPIDIEVIPGVTAACAGAAGLGAPLANDWCCISLSDQLTPWEAIERRLCAAASADFAICLYNPSSHARPHHLRRACDVLLAAGASPQTVCGLAHRIGRDGERFELSTLGELRDTPVDMFTTVFVGSSATRVVGSRMVTPRGYDLGERSVCESGAPEVLVFGGTSEGRELLEWISARGRVRAVACTATEYGGELVEGLPGVTSLVGPLDEAAKERLVGERRIACVVDATHPFATHISESLRALCAAHDLPLVRVRRPAAPLPEGSAAEGAEGSYGTPRSTAQEIPAESPSCVALLHACMDGEAELPHIEEGVQRVPTDPSAPSAADPSGSGASVVVVESVAAAACAVAGLPGNVLVATGAKGLGEFARALPDFAERVYARVLPSVESLEAARRTGLPSSHVIALQGPFSEELNTALIRQYGITVLVTKESGAAGGFSQKVAAAQACGCSLVVVSRPPDSSGLTLDQAKRLLEERYGS